MTHIRAENAALRIALDMETTASAVYAVDELQIVQKPDQTGLMVRVRLAPCPVCRGIRCRIAGSSGPGQNIPRKIPTAPQGI